MNWWLFVGFFMWPRNVNEDNLRWSLGFKLVSTFCLAMGLERLFA